jgi:type IV secretory pathway TraG/TraD family ATPase VirD4
MNNLVPAGTYWPAQAHPAPKPVRDVPLGTAAWMQFAPGTRLVFQTGQFWLGRLPNNDPVGFKDDRHVLVASGTRAGKGASVIIPNLCIWPGSVVVVDPKGENAMVTARRRGRGSTYCGGMNQKVRILDPFGAVGTSRDNFQDLKVAFNPLDAIQPNFPESVDEADRIAGALIVVENSKDPFWEESAKALLRALILHVVSHKDVAPAERNLVTVRKMLLSGDAETRNLLAMNLKPDELPSGLALLFGRMKRNQAFGGVIANAGEMLSGMLSNAPRLLGSIIQVACTNTDFIDSPQMRACLSRSDFSLSELKKERQGVSLYLCLPQRFMVTHYRWLRMLVTLTLTEMERVPHQPTSGHPILMVLDEFPGLGRMKVLENAAAQIAGFGVKMMFVVQTLAQLKDIYRDNWETIVANAGVKLFFGNDDHFTRDYVSRLVGDCEVIRTTQTHGTTEGRSTNASTSRTQGGSLSSSSGCSMGVNNSSTTSGTTHGTSWSNATTDAKGASQSTTRSISEAIHKRPLVTPDEVGRIFGDRHNPVALALIAGLQPLLLKRTAYFRDSGFLGSFDAHPDHPLPLNLKQIEQQDARERAEAQTREQRHQALLRQEREHAARLREEQRLATERRHRYHEDRFERRKAKARAKTIEKYEAERRKHVSTLLFALLASLPLHFGITGTSALGAFILRISAFATARMKVICTDDEIDWTTVPYESDY